jgi:NAD(P)-dependent dehydrogenase (short-subunit alcohol dehydrogenase family)
MSADDVATPTTSPTPQPAPDLLGQTVLVIGGSAGIGLHTARLARAHGAKLILTARDPDPLHRVGLELKASIAAFDATNLDRLERFFDALPTPIDHLLVTGPPTSMPLSAFDLEAAHRHIDAHLLLPLQVVRHAPATVRPGGTLVFLGNTAGRRPAPGQALLAALTAAQPALIKHLALELAPIRVNLLAAGDVDPANIAALAVHLMTNTAITGATLDIDGGQQLTQQ